MRSTNCSHNKSFFQQVCLDKSIDSVLLIASALGCGQVIHVGTAGENNTVKITSPEHPKNYNPDLECTWIIGTTKGFHLNLQFTVLNLEQFDDCDADFVRVYTGKFFFNFNILMRFYLLLLSLFANTFTLMF